MNVGVVGLWHLGSVTAACLANAKHQVTAYDPSTENISNLQQGKPPIYEPGLEDLVKQGMEQKRLVFTSSANDLAHVDILWITFDTPVDENDIADVKLVIEEIENLLSIVQENTLILISSQLPVATTKKLQTVCQEKYAHKHITFAYSPENLRLGKAINIFNNPDRIIVGIESDKDKARIESLLHPFSQNIIWMSVASAEMTKHALNAFLATSVVFINELASLCERVGADAREVEAGLKSEERIGPKAYLKPGAAIGGGTLARDVQFLIKTGHELGFETPFFNSLLQSNANHKKWSCQRLTDLFQNLQHKTIATLGLTYKPGTDTLRRSTAVETCKWLNQQGAQISAYDPAISNLPDQLSSFIQLKKSLSSALENADAVIITTEWPEFKSLTVEDLLAKVKQAIIFDPNGFLMNTFANDQRVRYFTVGKQA